MNKTIGYLGLGKMGKGMAEHLIEKGWKVVAYNRSPESVREIATKGAVPAYTLREVAQQTSSPRLIWLMVPHQAVDGVLADLVPLLEEGDTVIDGGNSFYKDSMRHAEELRAKGIHFLDAGTSGGPGGARAGACTMVGGEKEIFERYEDLFRDISVKDGYAYMGSAGAGHFVKMVHNGIEYGMMQAIGEGFEVMKHSPFDLNLAKVAELYNHQSVIESRLVGWAKSAFETYGEDLESISGSVSHSGEGLWTVQTAKEFEVPVPIIEGSLQFREDSVSHPSYTGQVVSALRNQFGGHEVKKREN